MIGMILFHPASGITGTVEATSLHPDGRALCRLDDCWFFVDECTAG